MSDPTNKKVIYDPLKEILNYYAGKKTETREEIPDTLPIEEKLKRHIIRGDKQKLEVHLQKALESYSPLSIINDILLDGMRVLGELFGKGELQLPFVLQSAEVMKAAVAFLEPMMEKKEGSAKGTLVLATVKGDVHDIGKNLVDIILTNNGYRVINLGIKCPIETMLHAAEEHRADAIGMSGLLVKSTLIMKENLEVMKERQWTIPVLLGGAALTKRYVDEELRTVYPAPVFYCEDAFQGLHTMDLITQKKIVPAEPETDMLDQKAHNTAEFIKRWKIVRHHWTKSFDYFPDDLFSHQRLPDGSTLQNKLQALIGREKSLLEKIQSDENISPESLFRTYEEERPAAALAGSTDDLSKTELLDAWNQIHQEFIRFLNHPRLREQRETDTSFWNALSDRIYRAEYAEWKIVRQWLLQTTPVKSTGHSIPRRSPKIQPAKQIPQPPFYGVRIVEDIPLDAIYPYINEVALFRGQWQFVKGNLSDEAYRELIAREARPVFEKWKRRAKEEKLLTPKVIYGYFPCQSDGDDLLILDEERKKEILRFTFPRQTEEPFLCISDFFSDIRSGVPDVLACHLVTIGRRASEFSMELFNQNAYTDYLYFHGLSVETAEALAEYWHREIRRELGIAQNDSDDIRKLFQQHYQGSRYSFGYPACPNLEDQTKLFELLRPERIGVQLSEGFQLHPEQSTSAIIVHHPQAKYFNVR